MTDLDFALADLRLFVAAATSGSITAAAARCHLSLAAASARIKALETRAGLPLFRRQARGVQATPAGEAFLHHASALLRQAEQLHADLRDYGGGLRGHVRVCANTTAVTDFLPELLPAFLKAHPRVNVELREALNTQIARDVADRRADIGIVAGRVHAPGLRAIHFSTDQLVLAVPRGHRLARRRRVAFADTLDEDHVGMHAASTLHGFLTEVTAALGRPLRLRIQLSSFDAMCRMVGAGVGVAVMPESTVRRHLASEGLALVELADDWRVRERLVLVREGETLPPYAQALIDALLAHHAGR